MVWVIQRDFLQGKSTQAAVREALGTVPNPNHEPSIEQARAPRMHAEPSGSSAQRQQTPAVQVNSIRRSLGLLARDSTSFGLPQPHLNRTMLCDLPEAALDAGYLRARDALRAHLHSSARAKRLGAGQPALDGRGLAALVEALVQARPSRPLLAVAPCILQNHPPRPDVAPWVLLPQLRGPCGGARACDRVRAWLEGRLGG